MYFVVAGGVASLVLWVGGGHFFGEAAVRAGQGVAWRGPWAMLLCLGVVQAATVPSVGVLEGFGEIRNLSRIRLWQGLVGTVALWGALLGGARLWSAPLSSLLGLTVLFGLLWAEHGELLRKVIGSGNHLGAVKWRSEILPLQWRVAISSASGYFLLQAATPVVLRYDSPARAGQMGMTVAVTTAILYFAAAWSNTKWGYFGAMVASGEYSALDRLFWSSLRRSLLVFGVLIAFLLLAIIALRQGGFSLGDRLLPIWLVVGVALLQAAIHLVSNLAAYTRAHKQEPLFWLLALYGICSAGGMWLFGKAFGASGVVISGVFVGWTLVVPAGVALTRRSVRMLRGGATNPVEPGVLAGSPPNGSLEGRGP